MKKSFAFAGLMALLVLALAAPSQAATITVGGGWSVFSFQDIGFVNNFDYTAAGPVVIKIVDCCIIGDEFSLSINGGTGISTSSALTDYGVDSGAVDGDTAWSVGLLSKLAVLGPSGLTTLDITHTAGFTQGDAFIRVDQATVPEPTSLALLGMGLGLLAIGGRKLGQSIR